MAVTTSPRMGVTRWSDSAADPFTRAQMDASHASLEALAARDEQGTLAARPAPALAGRYYFATDATALYRENGATWTQVATIPAANYFTGAVSLNADGVTPAAPAGGAALGVNRNVSGGGVFLTLKNNAVSGGVGWAMGTYTAGELGVGTGFSGGAWSTPPVMLVSTVGSVLADGEQHYFGGGAISGSGRAGTTCVTFGSFSSTTAAYMTSQGGTANIDMIVRAQGTGGLVWLQPNADTTKGLKVGTTGATFLQTVAVAAGGLSVAGSPSGYIDELAFTSTGAPAVGISSAATGAGQMSFDGRGPGNTMSWIWRNGSSAGSTRMLLTAAGALQVGGDTNQFGRGAIGGATGSFVQIGHYDNTDAFVQANSNSGNASLLLRATGTGYISIGNAATEAIRADPATALAAQDSALLLRYNNGSATGVGRVTVGAADSGGAGFRVLRVNN